MSHKLVFIFTIVFSVAIAFASCNTKEEKDAEKPVYTQRLQGDNAVYGLACDGCNDTVIVVLPEDNSDPGHTTSWRPSGEIASWARYKLETDFASC